MNQLQEDAVDACFVIDQDGFCLQHEVPRSASLNINRLCSQFHQIYQQSLRVSQMQSQLIPPATPPPILISPLPPNPSSPQAPGPLYSAEAANESTNTLSSQHSGFISKPNINHTPSALSTHSQQPGIDYFQQPRSAASASSDNADHVPTVIVYTKNGKRLILDSVSWNRERALVTVYRDD